MSALPFHPSAKTEALSASLYLESQREGYGAKFERELDKLLKRIEQFPDSGSRLPNYPEDLNVRAYRMMTFRYSIIVANPDGEPMVYAIAHQHRQPGYWLERIE
ncbi:MAG: hypothetical protein AAGF11_26105 [Myxococcota bacterium]